MRDDRRARLHGAQRVFEVFHPGAVFPTAAIVAGGFAGHEAPGICVTVKAAYAALAEKEAAEVLKVAGPLLSKNLH
jgi:hypothetical protein